MSFASLFHFEQAVLPFWTFEATRNRYQVLSSMPEELPTDSREVLSIILELWITDVHSGGLSEQTFQRYRALAEQFINFSQAQGAHNLEEALSVYEEWLCAWGRDRSGRLCTPAISVRQLRSCAVRALYSTAQTFGAAKSMPRYAGRDGSDTAKQGRPLNECEADRCRSVAWTFLDTRLAAAVALGFCGAGTADIGNMTSLHIDLKDGSLILPGSRQIKQRKVAIAGEWEYQVLEHRYKMLQDLGSPTNMGFIVRRNGSDASRQAGAAIALSKILSLAGYEKDKGLKPGSFQNWAGISVYDQTADVTAVAKLLGTKSLDAAARAIDLDWHNATPSRPKSNRIYRPRWLP